MADALCEAFRAVTLQENATEASHPPGLHRATRVPMLNQLYMTPTKSVAARDFLRRAPRIPLGISVSRETGHTCGYSFDPEASTLVEEILHADEGYVETRAICKVATGHELWTSAQIHRVSFHNTHSSFVIVGDDGNLIFVISAHDDDHEEDTGEANHAPLPVVRITQFELQRAEIKAPVHVLWLDGHIVALCRDGFVRAWVSGSSEIACSEKRYAAIDYIEACGDSVIAVDEIHGVLDVMTAERCSVWQSQCYLPSVGQSFDMTIGKEDMDRMQEKPLRVWAWRDFMSKSENAPFTWLVVTKTMWHMRLVGASTIIHMRAEGRPPQAATVSSDNRTLFIWREDSAVSVFDCNGRKRNLFGKPDSVCRRLQHGACEIMLSADETHLSVLMPSGWMQTFYFPDISVSNQ